MRSGSSSAEGRRCRSPCTGSVGLLTRCTSRVRGVRSELVKMSV
ncbi:hypothetical protein [Ornithinimicrobium kibberense]